MQEPLNDLKQVEAGQPETVVRFPLVGDGSRLASVRVNDHGFPKKIQRLATGGPGVFKLGLDDEVEWIVKAARQGETDLDHGARKVSVELLGCDDAAIQGESYGLALAIADYLARHPPLGRTDPHGRSLAERKLVATGTLTANGDRMGAVGEMQRKLTCILKSQEAGELQPGDLFFFPKENEEALDAEQRALLAELVERGLRCLAVESMAEVRRKLMPPPPPPGWSGWGRTWRGLILVLAAVVSGFVWWLLATAGSGGAGDPPLTFALNHPDSSADEADVVVQFSYGGLDGEAQFVLAGKEPVLRSGDRFSVVVTVNRDAYLYLIHFDAAGSVSMLVADAATGSASAGIDANFLRAGQRLPLPSEGWHYRLDENTGHEHFHIIVSPVPIAGLRDAYTRALAAGETDEMLGMVRGIAVFQDPGGQVPQPQRQTPDTLQCLAPSRACRDSFSFKHIR